MFKKIESIINKSPFYNIIRFNQVSDLIVELKTNRTKKAIAFFESFLTKESANKLVFDIGANKGNKVKAFLKMGFKVVAVEPEKKALSTLKWRFSKNKNVNIVNKGISDSVSTLTIHIAEDRSGLNTLSDKWVQSLEDKKDNRWHKKHSFKKSYDIEVTTLEQLFAEYGDPFFIKIDVEGYEKKVIMGLKKMPPYLSFETNLPEFLQESLDCIEYLSSLSEKTMFNYSINDQLEADAWLSADGIRKIISDPSLRYMEIICRSI